MQERKPDKQRGPVRQQRGKKKQVWKVATTTAAEQRRTPTSFCVCRLETLQQQGPESEGERGRWCQSVLCTPPPPLPLSNPSTNKSHFFPRAGEIKLHREVCVCVGLRVSQSSHSICTHSSPPACACRRHHRCRRLSKHLLGKARRH